MIMGNVEQQSASDHSRTFEEEESGVKLKVRTNLVQTTLIGENSDMSIVACAS
jgi:hypothetical protein